MFIRNSLPRLFLFLSIQPQSQLLIVLMNHGQLKGLVLPRQFNSKKSNQFRRTFLPLVVNYHHLSSAAYKYEEERERERERERETNLDYANKNIVE